MTMASTDPKSGPSRDLPSDQALTALGRALLRPDAQPETAGAGLTGRGGAEVELTLADLLSDDNGEVVFFNDSCVRSLAIATEAAVVADGSAGAHVTASGADVTGYQFVTFDTGVTLYFQPDLDLVVQREMRER